MRTLLYQWKSALLVAALCFLPAVEPLLPDLLRISDTMRTIFVFAILGLGLNVVTGFTGLLNLGVAAFMAIGAYTFAILTCAIYPFQIGFWAGLAAATVAGAAAGFALGLPTIRLRGDYLAIVTLGFGEIVQDVIKNLEVVTKGTQGINPLPPPAIAGYVFPAENHLPWYYLYFALLLLVVLLHRNLLRSRIGRSWEAVRDDELAASCAGIPVVRTKLLAFSVGAATAALAGAMSAALLGSSGEPGNYDFQISIIALCIVIVGGLGSIRGVLLGAALMVGFNSILLTRLSAYLASRGLADSANVFASPGNWKYLVFGLALILTMRFKPDGLLPARLGEGITGQRR